MTVPLHNFGRLMDKQSELKARIWWMFQDCSDDREDQGERQEGSRENSTVVVVLDEDQNRRVDAHEAGELLTKQSSSNHDVHRQLRLPAILLLPAPRSIYF